MSTRNRKVRARNLTYFENGADQEYDDELDIVATRLRLGMNENRDCYHRNVRAG